MLLRADLHFKFPANDGQKLHPAMLMRLSLSTRNRAKLSAIRVQPPLYGREIQRFKEE
jgi:hypothetical protein